MNDLRRRKRVPLDIYLNKFVAGAPYLVRASDISREAIYVNQLIEPEVGERSFALQFCLPGSSEVIFAEAEVVRDGNRAAVTGHALRFTLLSEEHRKLIDAFVERGEASCVAAA